MTDVIPGIEGRVPLSLKPSMHNSGNGGTSATFGITNGIGDTTTIHWHGLHVPDAADGGASKD